MGGLVVVNNNQLAEQLKFIQNSSGGILGPFDSWLTIRGIETLALRVQKHSENALKVAEFLQSCEEIENLYYPGLSSHKNHEIAKKQQSGGYGGIVSFSLK